MNIVREYYQIVLNCENSFYYCVFFWFGKNMTILWSSGAKEIFCDFGITPNKFDYVVQDFKQDWFVLVVG